MKNILIPLALFFLSFICAHYANGTNLLGFWYAITTLVSGIAGVITAVTLNTKQ